MSSKFLIIGDLHGNMPKIYFKDFDYIIAPGDFCSDALRKYMFQALQQKLNDSKSKVNWYDLVGKKRAKKMVDKSLKDGRKILEFLNSFNKPIILVPGNWDWTEDGDSSWSYLRKDHYSKLINGLKNLNDVYHSLLIDDKVCFLGHGISSGPEYPQYKEDLKRYTKTELKDLKKNYNLVMKNLGTLFQFAGKTKKPIIFVSHNVPFNTPIDKITDRKSPRYGYHYGSLVAKELTLKYQPLVCIGGHMHEHFKSIKLGKTVCINSGFGSYVNTFLEIEGNKIKKLKFHRGKS